jgi:hypothetical protein
MSSLIHLGSGTYRDAELSQDSARLLRDYRTFLVRRHIREGLWCKTCAEAGQPEGVKAFVKDDRIELRCRCTLRTYRGQSY